MSKSGSDLLVSLNTGSGFTEPVVWHGALEDKHITDTANIIGGHKIRDGEGTFEELCFIFMACFNSRESNKEHGYMSDGTVIC